MTSRAASVICALGIGVVMSSETSPATQTPPPPHSQTTSAERPQKLLHTHEQFEFVADAPVNVAFPLFGAKGERAWAPGWDPAFVWPADATDRAGMVFRISHGDHAAIWVNTVFDPAANRVQYVYVIPDVVVTVITLNLAPIGQSTHVSVSYERTALSSGAEELVRHMALNDSKSGPDWAEQINGYLKSRS